MTLRGRPSRREHLLAIKGQLDGLSILTGKQHQYLTQIPEKRAPRQSREPTAGASEHEVNHAIRDALKGYQHGKLWRNNRGVVELHNGQRLRYGVGPNGAADWIGYRTIVVTPGMVGQRLAVFTAVEAKRPGALPDEAQQQFIELIRDAGGRAGVASSADAALEILNATTR